MRVLERRVYRGPNLYAHFPVIRLTVDLGVLEDYPSNKIQGFVSKLLKRLPHLDEHGCSYEQAGGFVRRLREGTWIGHVWEHVAIELQNLAGAHVSFGKTRSTGRPREYHVVYEYEEAHVGERAGKLAQLLIESLLPKKLRVLVRPPGGEEEQELDFDTEIEDLIRYAQKRQLGPSTFSLVKAAEVRGIPWFRLNDYSLVQLGHGRFQKRIQATVTSETRQIAVEIASDKAQTNRILADIGLPVPPQMIVYSLREALEAAEDIGYPVVVKPLDGNHGRGVGLNLMDDDAVRAAFALAKAESRGGYVVVESFITGRDYRCLIVGGRMQAIAERVPAHVIGDGEHTIEELVAITNSDPRRGVGHEKVLTKIKVDEAAIERVRDQGFELDSVPGKGIMVKLALTGNMSTGGISIDRTFDAHPDNVEIAEEAARLVGLDVAGIDFIAPDIASPVRETGGAICEVNAAPGFRMHTHPTIGEPQFIAKPVVDLLFPPGAPSRVPIVAVTGTNGKTTTSRMIAHIMKGVGRKVGMTSTDGIVIDERLVVKADASGPKSARMVLQNPRVDFAVMEVARGGILREGLGYDRNDVAVVTNVAADHLGIRGIDTVEQLADVKAVIVEAVPRDGVAVLNADDPLVRRMRRRCSGDIVWFSIAAPGSRVREFIDDHCRRGWRAIVLEPTDRGDMIVIRHGRRSMQLAWTHLLPATLGGTAMFNVANAMAAAGAAFALGTGLHEIRQGLRTFSTSYYLSPGRMNLVDVHNVEVIVDYCHNAPGMRVLGDFVERYAAHKARSAELGKMSRIGMIATAGDRRDDDMRELGAIAADHFDVLVVREDARLRGRKSGETSGLIAEGARARMAEGGARCRQVEIVLDETAAVRHVMARANPGDLVVLCVDSHAAVMSELEAMTQQAQPGTHTTRDGVGDPDLDPNALSERARQEGDDAAADLGEPQPAEA